MHSNNRFVLLLLSIAKHLMSSILTTHSIHDNADISTAAAVVAVHVSLNE